MNVKNAITNAIEQGYDMKRVTSEPPSPITVEGLVLLDPQFWKCFAKSMGWERVSFCCGVKTKRFPKDTDQGNGIIIPVWYEWCNACGKKCLLVSEMDWQKAWYKFIDHLTENKTIESYFEEL